MEAYSRAVAVEDHRSRTSSNKTRMISKAEAKGQMSGPVSQTLDPSSSFLFSFGTGKRKTSGRHWAATDQEVEAASRMISSSSWGSALSPVWY